MVSTSWEEIPPHGKLYFSKEVSFTAPRLIQDVCFSHTDLNPSFRLMQNKLIPYQRPYHIENTGSPPITKVKQHWAWLLLGWVTAWEHHVLLETFYRARWLRGNARDSHSGGP